MPQVAGSCASSEPSGCSDGFSLLGSEMVFPVSAWTLALTSKLLVTYLPNIQLCQQSTNFLHHLAYGLWAAFCYTDLLLLPSFWGSSISKNLPHFLHQFFFVLFVCFGQSLCDSGYLWIHHVPFHKFLIQNYTCNPTHTSKSAWLTIDINYPLAHPSSYKPTSFPLLVPLRIPMVNDLTSFTQHLAFPLNPEVLTLVYCIEENLTLGVDPFPVIQLFFEGRGNSVKTQISTYI